MSQSIIDGDAEAAATLARQAVEQGLDPLEAINQGSVPGAVEAAKRLVRM